MISTAPNDRRPTPMGISMECAQVRALTFEEALMMVGEGGGGEGMMCFRIFEGLWKAIQGDRRERQLWPATADGTLNTFLDQAYLTAKRFTQPIDSDAVRIKIDTVVRLLRLVREGSSSAEVARLVSAAGDSLAGFASPKMSGQECGASVAGNGRHLHERRRKAPPRSRASDPEAEHVT